MFPHILRPAKRTRRGPRPHQQHPSRGLPCSTGWVLCKDYHNQLLLPGAGLAHCAPAKLDSELRADKAILQASEQLTPPSSHRPPKKPYTIAHLTNSFSKLKAESSLDATMCACSATLFFGIAQTRELTIPAENTFDPTKHVLVSHVHSDRDRQGNRITVVHIPVIKTDHL